MRPLTATIVWAALALTLVALLPRPASCAPVEGSSAWELQSSQSPDSTTEAPAGEAHAQPGGQSADAARYELIPWNSGHGAAMEPSAMNLMSAAQAVSQIGDAITEGKLFAQPGETYAYGRLLGRIARTAVVDIWVMRWLSTAHHEAAGHSGRAREFGAHAGRIHVDSFWSFGGGNSVDYAALNDYQFCTAKTGGSESDSVWAEETLRRTLGQSKARYSDLPYVWLKIDMPMYVLGTPSPASPGWARNARECWDVSCYLVRFQRHSDRPLGELHDASHRGAVWSLLDPRFVASTYAYFVGYVAQGRRETPLPMLRFAGASFLPGTGFHLSPLGPEYYAYLHVKSGQQLLTLYGRRAVGHRNGSGHGFGVEGRGIVRRRLLALDAAADFWRQPVDVTLAPATADAGPGISGVNAETRLVVPKLSDRWRLGVVVKAGYKTKGFLLGRPLAGGWYGHVGLAVHP